MGALEAPQDKHGQEHRTGTSRAEQTDRDHGGAGSSGGHGGAGSSGGHGGAGSSGGHGRWSSGPWPRSPWPGPYSRNPFTPPQNFPGEVRGYQEPSGAKHTHDRTRLQGQTDRTGQPTGTGSPPELARRLRLLLGMTMSQRPSQGPSATRLHISDKGAGG